MTYPVLSAISPDKSLQVASSPSFQIIFMVHPHIFLVEAPFFHHHEFSMNFLSLTLWSCPACWKIHRGWTLQGEKPTVQQVILGQLLPYINSKSIYKSIKHIWISCLASWKFQFFIYFTIISSSFYHHFLEFPHFVTGFGTRCFSSGGREEFRCDIIETPTQYDGVGTQWVLGESQP